MKTTAKAILMNGGQKVRLCNQMTRPAVLECIPHVDIRLPALGPDGMEVLVALCGRVVCVWDPSIDITIRFEAEGDNPDGRSLWELGWEILSRVHQQRDTKTLLAAKKFRWGGWVCHYAGVFNRDPDSGELERFTN